MLLYEYVFLICFFTPTEGYRTSTCLHRHEEFSLCGWRCPVTCVNIKLLKRGGSLCSSKWECLVGCRCEAGYIRDEYSKDCVLVQQCPVSVVSAAPATNDVGNRDWQRDFIESADYNRLLEGYRAQRSNYGSMYVSPCAAAAASAQSQGYGAAAVSAPVHAYAQAASATPYSYQAYQVPAHIRHQSYYNSHPYYRSEEEPENEQEIMNLSDQVPFGHVPMARNSYVAAPAGESVGSGQAAAGPVVGVFRNANVGGCSVPLLVSCSPSITHGRMIHQAYGSAPSANQGYMYRAVDEHHHHHEDSDGHQVKSTQPPEKSTSNDSKTTLR